MPTAECSICHRETNQPHEMGPWSVPRVKPDDDGIRWACQGKCSGALYEKVRGYLRGKA